MVASDTVISALAFHWLVIIIKWGVCDLPNCVGLENIGKYFYETDELPNLRPTQPKKNGVRNGVWATFFPHRKYFFVGYDWFYIGNTLQET